QFLTVLWYIWRFEMGKNPLRISYVIKRLLSYKANRGMDYISDIRDWVGGWPMEFAYDKDVIQFAKNELNMELVKISTGEANSEFLFKKL
ncbi:MAG: hypothetical protein ACE5RC_04245, partial [Nitrosopumilus sp.]